MWTRNNDRVRPGYNWVRWYPNLTPGRYEVLVYMPERHSTTSHARYWVSHRAIQADLREQFAPYMPEEK